MGDMYTLLWCVSVLFANAAAIPKDYLYEFWDASVLPKGDDVSEEVRLIVPIIYYGITFKTIYVNSNGILSFQTEIPQFFNSEFPLDYPIIAPLYSNVDTTSAGRISYLETDDAKTLQTAEEKIRDYFSEAKDFHPTSVFLVTWENVGYHNNGSDKVNNFQVAIISNNDDSYVEFLYPENGIQWIQGTGDGSGLPDARAQAGIIAPDGRYYLLPGSGTDKVSFLTRWTNTNHGGMWLFRVGIVYEENNIEIPDTGVEEEVQYNVPKTCAQSSTQCHSNAKCVDYEDGFCCQCNKKYYGNGQFCVKNDVPIRVNGKVSGNVNGISFSNLDLQCYVAMKDSRTYTAISKVPYEIGISSQSLQILGSTIGWVFAKPLGDAVNGFQITGGVFNHTVELSSETTDHVLRVKQTYLGLDVFDRLRLEVELDGTIPVLPETVNTVISEYQEQYSVTALGVIQSLSTRMLKYNDSYKDVELPFKAKQDILYDYCKYTTPQVGVAWKLKVGKNFVSYEAREQIIRFGLSSKIGPLEDIDPCDEGRSTCKAHSSCVVDGDSFRCICNPGFQEIENNGELQCVDINECQRGQHNCDLNAICINEAGTYRCECKSDYTGNGRTCEPARSCASVTCPENSECVQTDTAKCECLSGFVFTGQACIALKGHSCYYGNNCSPYGYCSLSPEYEYKCYCLPGYTGDGYTCVNITEPTVTTTEAVLETTVTEVKPIPPTTEAVLTSSIEEEEEKSVVETNFNRVEQSCIFDQCWCPAGYEKIPDSIYCHRIQTESTTPSENIDEISESCNVLKNCDFNANCLFSASGSYNCVCKPGYKGDGYKCEVLEESCLENNICDINARCQYNDLGKAICVCRLGYQGDGLTCSPMAICTKDEDCPPNEECSYDHNTNGYECLCREGLIRDSQHQCVAIDDNCGGGVCVENAECLYDSHYQTFYCACKANFTGDGITECKRKVIGCDILNNCDSNAFCNYNTSSEIYECQCSPGYLGNGLACEREKDCHTDPYICDSYARCITNAQRKYICECRPGYIGNGTFCKEIPKYGGNFLLLNQGMATLKVPFEISKKDRPKPIQVQIQQIAVGLDADCLEGRFYWSDIFSRAIRSATFNGTEKKDFIAYGIGSPEGISIDWVSRNIYWTDSTNKSIEIANIDTRLTRSLITANLVNPRGIAVHPQRGKIFWSDWDRKSPKIEWANADGTDRQIFLNGSDVELPNSLTIDFDTEHLCYADAGIKSVRCVDIDTKIKRVIASNCSYPFGIAATRTRIYWSDWITKKIEQVDKSTLNRLKPLTIPMGGGSNKLYEVAAVEERCPSLINVCQYHKEQCPAGRICIPDGKGSRRCLCGKNVDPTSEQSTCNDL